MPQIAYSTGPKFPTTTTTPNGSGVSGQWANPTNIFADDAANATDADVTTSHGITDSLIGQGFGFNIPPNAVIDGIKVEIHIPTSNRYFEAASSFRLMKAGVSGGTNQAGLGNVSNGLYTYGGTTNLWGQTWTPAQINASNFGLDAWYSVSSSPADFAISVNYYRITVYWHYNVDVAPADVPKRYIYKVFNDSIYLGSLPKVGTEFTYSLDINSVGQSINIECGVSADTASLPGSRLVTEAGDPITTEAGEYIYTDGQPPIIGKGDSLDPYLIQNGNHIEVWEYGYYHPNGILMYKGRVDRIEAGFGDSADNKITLKLNSDGSDLDNLIARGSPFAYSLDVAQGQNGLYALAFEQSKGAGWNRYGQTWTPGAGVTNLGAIDIGLNGNCDVTVTVYDGVGGSILGQSTQTITTNGGYAVIRFAFPALIPVSVGSTYFFAISLGAGQQCYVHYNPDLYAGGQMYNSSYGGGGGGAYSPVNGYDLNFWTYYGANQTTATYTSKDPSTGMLAPIMDDYKLRGGNINYTPTSIDATGLSLTATFNTESILDALKEVLSLSPSGFYYYVDLGTDTLYFKRTLTTPTYKLIKGRHLNKFNLVLSTENVKNDVLFSGATIAGTNLFTEYRDQASVGNYGIRLDRQSDNRVSLQPTADAIGQSFIAANKNEYYETTVTVLDRTMDITQFKPGQTVGLRGFGSFIDGLTLQIVRIEYFPNYANLTLGNLPQRFSDTFESVVRGLAAEQTVANPSAPS